VTAGCAAGRQDRHSELPALSRSNGSRPRRAVCRATATLCRATSWSLTA